MVGPTMYSGKTCLVTLQDLDEEPIVFDEVFPLRSVAPAAFQKSHHHNRVSLLWPTKGFRAKALRRKEGTERETGLSCQRIPFAPSRLCVKNALWVRLRLMDIDAWWIAQSVATPPPSGLVPMGRCLKHTTTCGLISSQFFGGSSFSIFNTSGATRGKKW